MIYDDIKLYQQSIYYFFSFLVNVYIRFYLISSVTKQMLYTYNISLFKLKKKCQTEILKLGLQNEVWNSFIYFQIIYTFTALWIPRLGVSMDLICFLFNENTI